ncbi:VOC family protein [Synechococcus sp. BS56D]|uniref:VOC family protein n=1 Tax=Synechococcus sp. BS56D TaxID=2055944 RepID=UPI00138764CA|nr:VOC family protein [Synechococcus sp. BS56D]
MADMQRPSLPIEALDHVALTVRDPELSMAWYQRVLGFAEARMEGLQQGPPFLLRVSPGNYLNLFPADSADPSGVPDHNSIAMRHVAFRVSYGALAEVESYLRNLGEAVTGFDYGPRCRALFISDPDGHQLELIGYADGVFTA